MTRHESKSSLTFRKWVSANAGSLISCTFEMKDSRGEDSLPFIKIEEPQIDHAMAIKWSKKGDLIRVESGTIGAPDYVFYKNAPAYIVIKYPNCFTIIDIETFTEEKARSKRKSLTVVRAKEIAWRVINL